MKAKDAAAWWYVPNHRRDFHAYIVWLGLLAYLTLGSMVLLSITKIHLIAAPGCVGLLSTFVWLVMGICNMNCYHDDCSIDDPDCKRHIWGPLELAWMALHWMVDFAWHLHHEQRRLTRDRIDELGKKIAEDHARWKERINSL